MYRTLEIEKPLYRVFHKGVPCSKRFGGPAIYTRYSNAEQFVRSRVNDYPDIIKYENFDIVFYYAEGGLLDAFKVRKVEESNPAKYQNRD